MTARDDLAESVTIKLLNATDDLPDDADRGVAAVLDALLDPEGLWPLLLAAAAEAGLADECSRYDTGRFLYEHCFVTPWRLVEAPDGR